MYTVRPDILLCCEAAAWESWCKTYAPYWHAAVEGSCCESLSFWKQIHNKLLKLMFHGYKIHTRTSLFTASFHLNPCVCMFGRETVSFMESQHSHSLLASLCAAILALFIFPSYPKHGNAPCSSDLACALMCAHTDLYEPSHSLDLPVFLLLPH